MPEKTGSRVISRESPEPFENRRSRLKALLPEAFPDGELDVAALREVLGEASEETKEKYGIRWPGRQEAIRLLQTVTTGTLAPVSADTDFRKAPNHVWIHGENLE